MVLEESQHTSNKKQKTCLYETTVLYYFFLFC